MLAVHSLAILAAVAMAAAMAIASVVVLSYAFWGTTATRSTKNLSTSWAATTTNLRHSSSCWSLSWWGASFLTGKGASGMVRNPLPLLVLVVLAEVEALREDSQARHLDLQDCLLLAPLF